MSLESQLEEAKEREQRAMQLAEKQLNLLTHSNEQEQQKQEPVKRGWFRRRSA